MADEVRIDQIYNENFYRSQKDASYRSAEVIIPLVMKYVQPRSVIDVGCGVAPWLSVFQKFGARVYGVDGDYVDRTQLYIDQNDFHPANLEERLNVGERFDLAMTMEVAEHLSPARADTFVEDLTKLSDVVLFSAAAAAQGGDHHINEQMPSYWASKFARHGYVCIDCIRPQVWTDQRIQVWYRQNVLLFVNIDALKNYWELKVFYLEHRNSTVIDIIHPQMWLERTIYFQQQVAALQNFIQAHTVIVPQPPPHPDQQK